MAFVHGLGARHGQASEQGKASASGPSVGLVRSHCAEVVQPVCRDELVFSSAGLSQHGPAFMGRMRKALHDSRMDMRKQAWRARDRAPGSRSNLDSGAAFDSTKPCRRGGGASVTRDG
jgi:hypothetical protein